MMASHQRVCNNLIIMQNYLLEEGLYINDFHRRNSMAAQREVLCMSLHPYSREQKIAQIQSLKEGRNSKENSNMQRNKLAQLRNISQKQV